MGLNLAQTLCEKRNMKVVFVIKTLVHSVGGAEKLTAQMAGEMAQNGVDMHLMTFDRPNDVPFYAISPSVTRHYVCADNTSRKTGLLEYPKLLMRIRRDLKALQPDCVVAFMHSSFVPVQCALLGTGIKVVLSEHTVPAYYKARKFEYALLWFFSFFAASITIISERVRAIYPRAMRRKMHILPNMIDSDFEAADVYGTDKAVKTILSVGRLNADKDHAILIDAYVLLAHEFPDWNLCIVGEGEEREALTQKIRSLKLHDRISLPGTVKGMNSIYKSAQLFVHPSRYENFGLVTAEAMSHSLPVIGFADCPGTNELIRHGENGELVEVRNAPALAESIRGLILSSEQRIFYGRNGLECAKDLRPNNATDQWISYLSGL